MLLKWFKIKKAEIEIKYMLLQFIKTVINEQEDIVGLFRKIYVEIKDVPTEELQDKLISAIANLAHEQAIKERNSFE